jgi:hypothetical protein
MGSVPAQKLGAKTAFSNGEEVLRLILGILYLLYCIHGNESIYCMVLLLASVDCILVETTKNLRRDQSVLVPAKMRTGYCMFTTTW